MFIVRYSEIGLKGSRARDRMEQVLMRNIKRGLGELGASAEVKRGFGRIYIMGNPDSKVVADVLSRTMGVKSFSDAVTFKFQGLQEIVNISIELWSTFLKGKSFAVRARRTGTHSFKSTDIMRSVGDALYKYSESVDLSSPDVELSIEVRENTAYFYTDSIPGPGGLPLGSEGKLVALVSGGIDSPVAAWYVMKRGCPTDIIFVSLAPPIDTVDFLRAAGKLLKRWSHGYDARIHVIDGRKLVETLTDSDRFKLTNVTYKRILYLIAQEIAVRSGAHGIVTGESLGQVSSQTPESLHATSHGLEIPVIRPLIGMDKDEIVALARKIGTFPETTNGEFCALFALKPITKPKVEELEEDMKNFTLLQEIVETDHVIMGSEIDQYFESLSIPNVKATSIPANAIVVDLRSREKFDEWHYEGAIRSSLGSLDSVIESNGKERTFVFYCMKGLQSAFAASKAREAGVNAYFIDEKMLKQKERRIA